MFHVCIAHCMPEKIHKISKCENSCLFMWSTVLILGLCPKLKNEWNKWKNQMKGDVGMSPHEKESLHSCFF